MQELSLPRLRPARATVAVLIALFHSSVFAAAEDMCIPLSGPDAALGAWNSNVEPGRSQALTLTLPAGRDVFLAASESSADVTLEDVAGVYADNPVRRSGTLHVLRRVQSDGRMVLHLNPKTSSPTGGRVLLRAYQADPAIVGRHCRAALEAIAGADAEYARGQLISAGRTSSRGGTALSHYRSARQLYLRALETLGSAAPPVAVAPVLLSLAALTYQDLQDWADSERYAKRAAESFAGQGDRYGAARARALQAAAWMELATLPAEASGPGKTDTHPSLAGARALLSALATDHARHGETYDEALQLNNLGLAFYYEGLYEAAVRSYRRALPLYQQLGERHRLAQVYQNIALVQWELGRFPQAIDEYQHALSFLSAEASPKLYGDILNNLGPANLNVGRVDLALQEHSEALEIFRRIQDRREEARSLFGLATVYTAVGDRELAKEFLHQSLDIRTAALDARGRVASLYSLALLSSQEGDAQEVLKLGNEALSIATDLPARVRILVLVADAHLALGDPAAARETLTSAAAIAARSDDVSAAVVALEWATLERRAQDYDRAYRDGTRALATFNRMDLTQSSFRACVELAEIDIGRGRPAAAMRHIDRALKLVEEIRTQAVDPELRAGLMLSVRKAFDLKVELLAGAYQRAQAHDDANAAERAAGAALETSEQARARALEDFARVRRGRSDASFTALLERKSLLLKELAGRRYQLGRSEQDAGAAGRQVATIRAELATLRHELTAVDTQIEKSLASDNPRSTTSDWKQWTTAVPSDTEIVAYWLTPATAYAWVVTNGSLRWLNLGSAESIRTAALTAHSADRALQSRTAEDRRLAGEQLAALVLDPIVAATPAAVSQLVFMPDGPLHYISFAALRYHAASRSQLLVAAYEVAYAMRMAPHRDRRSLPQDRLLVVADPVYTRNDPRWRQLGVQPPERSQVSGARFRSVQSGESYERLPGTAAEAALVASRFAGRVDRLEGFDATRSSVLALPLEQYQYIHLAVHGATDSEIPQLSSLILSAFNRMGQVIEEHLWAGDLLTRDISADIVVLSACDTALGKHIGGEGLVGLRYVMVARGARSVVASLWTIPDRNTAYLMGEFYERLLTHHVVPAAALAGAMRGEIARGQSDAGLWGAFTVTRMSAVN